MNIITKNCKQNVISPIVNDLIQFKDPTKTIDEKIKLLKPYKQCASGVKGLEQLKVDVRSHIKSLQNQDSTSLSLLLDKVASIQSLFEKLDKTSYVFTTDHNNPTAPIPLAPLPEKTEDLSAVYAIAVGTEKDDEAFNYAKAEEEAAKLSPLSDKVIAQLKLARVYFSKNQYGAALEMFNMAANENADEGRVGVIKCYDRLKEQDPSKVISLYETIKNRSKMTASAYNFTGHCYFKNKDNKKATEAFLSACNIEIDPEKLKEFESLTQDYGAKMMYLHKAALLGDKVAMIHYLINKLMKENSDLDGNWKWLLSLVSQHLETLDPQKRTAEKKAEFIAEFTYDFVEIFKSIFPLYYRRLEYDRINNFTIKCCGRGLLF